MANLMASLSLLTFNPNDEVYIVGLDCTSLRSSQTEVLERYSIEKEHYINSRKSKVKSLQKVKECMKDVYQLFLNHRCVHLQWNVQQPLILFFSSGTIVAIYLDEKKKSITKIVFDTSLCGKLVSEHLTDVIFSDSYLLISYSEPKLTYVQFTKQPPPLSSKLLGNKKGKIIGFEPGITTIDLIGPSSRRFEKKLCLNNRKDCVLVWWHLTSGDVWPWMPIDHCVDRNSMLVYVLSGKHISALCSAKVHGELVHAQFSNCHSNHILTLEQITEFDQYSVNICTYEIVYHRCQCISLSKLPLQGQLVAFQWNSSEDKLLLSDEGKNVLIYDLSKNTTLVTTTTFVPNQVAWHPEGAFFSVINTNGVLQFFDEALTIMKSQLYGELSSPSTILQLNTIFHPKRFVKTAMWHNSDIKHIVIKPCDMHNKMPTTLLLYFDTGCFVFINFSFGSITRNNATPLELISQYLKSGCVDESVSLLQSLNWCQQADLCYHCLAKISNYLLKKPFTIFVESALESTLGTFYSAVEDLPETVVHEYKHRVDNIARRFFHYLLRYHSIKKAYLLAIDLQFRDLFLDLIHVARQNHEPILAFVAYKHAEQLESDDSGTYQSEVSAEGGSEFSSSADECKKLAALNSSSAVLEDHTGLHNVARGDMSSSKNAPSSQQRRDSSPRSFYAGRYFDAGSETSRKLKCYFQDDSSSSSESINEQSLFSYFKSPEHLDFVESAGHGLSCNSFHVNATTSFEVTEIECPNNSNPDCQRNTSGKFKESGHSRTIVAEQDNNDDDDTEGARVKFEHFGIV